MWSNLAYTSEIKLTSFLYLKDINMIFISMGWDYIIWTAATNGPIVHPPYDNEYGEPRWNDTDRAKPKNSEKTCPSAIFPTNPTRIDQGFFLIKYQLV
jgi:hypothetical protein